jgi:hypothetical protein
MLEFQLINMEMAKLIHGPLVVSTVLPLTNMLNSAWAFLCRSSIGIHPTSHAQAIVACSVLVWPVLTMIVLADAKIRCLSDKNMP